MVSNIYISQHWYDDLSRVWGNASNRESYDLLLARTRYTRCLFNLSSLLVPCSVLSCHLLACVSLSYLVLSYLFLACPLSKTPSLELLAFVFRYACVLQAIHHKDIKQGTFRSWVDLYSLLVPCSVLSCHLLACLILSFLLLRRINALPFTPHQTQTLPQTLQGNRTLKRMYDHKIWTLKMFIKNEH